VFIRGVFGQLTECAGGALLNPSMSLWLLYAGRMIGGWVLRLEM